MTDTSTLEYSIDDYLCLYYAIYWMAFIEPVRAFPLAQFALPFSFWITFDILQMTVNVSIVCAWHKCTLYMLHRLVVKRNIVIRYMSLRSHLTLDYRIWKYLHKIYQKWRQCRKSRRKSLKMNQNYLSNWARENWAHQIFYCIKN